MTNADFRSVDDLRDIESLNYFSGVVARGGDPDAAFARIRIMSRDHARTPMQWDDSERAGFSSATPWIDVNANYRAINAAAAVADPGSIYHWYRRLADLRRTEPTVASGDFTMLLADDEQVYAFTRRYDRTELLIVANFSDSPLYLKLAEATDWAEAELLITNCARPAQDHTSVELHEWEVRVYRRTDCVS